MTWLTWRQSQLESAIGGAALAVVSIFLILTGRTISAAYHDAGLPACLSSGTTDPGCANAIDAFMNRFNSLNGLVGWLNLVPFLIGLLLAAPTVLDLEQGTYRLAWTQSVTRRRWIAGKIGFGLIASVAVAAGLIALWTWWREPFDRIDGRFGSDSFDFEGTVAIGYLVFAFSLCLTAGVVLRRSIPTFGIGFVGFMIARLGVMDRLRPHYLEPRKVTWNPLDPPPSAVENLTGRGNWIVDHTFLNQQGTAIDPFQLCGSSLVGVVKENVQRVERGSDDAFNRCLQDNGVVNALLYHPASRFWTFQAIETAIFLGVSAALLAFTYWWVTRRVV